MSDLEAKASLTAPSLSRENVVLAHTVDSDLRDVHLCTQGVRDNHCKKATGLIDIGHCVIGAFGLLRDTVQWFRSDVGHGSCIDMVSDHLIRWYQIRLDKGDGYPAHQSATPTISAEESQAKV
jgi:hypothetical protein